MKETMLYLGLVGLGLLYSPILAKRQRGELPNNRFIKISAVFLLIIVTTVFHYPYNLIFLWIAIPVISVIYFLNRKKKVKP